MALSDFIKGKDAKWWEEHWQQMPEYDNEILKPWKQLIVSFSSEEDYRDFEKLIGQALTLKTRSIWFPKVDAQKMKRMA